MTQTYVITFFSHYDAVQFSQRAKKIGFDTKLMPVPRKISSSCGTGARCVVEERHDLSSLIEDGIDKIYLYDGNDYSLFYDVDSE